MQEELRTKLILFFIIFLNLFLNIYGNEWGLPSRWHSDEIVANVLHMAEGKTLVDPIGEFLRPTGYHLFLLASFIPVYLYLKLINYPIESLKDAASVSWVYMARFFPDFATGIYIYARTLSAILGALTVYLIYLVGKEIYDEKTGLFSAAFLSVCMGFIGVNHFAKYIALLNLLIVVVILLCLKTLRKESFKNSQRFLFFGFLIAGLASSVHINAPLLLLPLFLVFSFIAINIFNKFRKFILLPISCISLYVAGIILGTPTLLTNFMDYFSRFGLIYKFPLIGKPIAEKMPLFVGPINYLFEILSIYGIPLFVLILAGIIRALFSWKKISKKEFIIFSFVFIYYFMMTVLFEDKYPQTKHIIAIVPLLAIFAGRTMADIFMNKRISKISKYVFFALVFLYSFVYAFESDLYFKKGDVRYESTQWIIKNIPKGAKIEVFDQLNYVASTDIMGDYEIIYLGRSSVSFQGKHFFKWNTVENRKGYLKYINMHDSLSDYIIIDTPSGDLDELRFPNSGDSHLPGLNEYMRTLVQGKKNFRVVKIIRPKNRKIKSTKIKGLVYQENLWWNPIPSYRDTANTICIFKRINDVVKGKSK